MQLKNYSLTVGKRELFSDVSVEFQNGTICNLLGGNGVGKSSFAKSLMNILDYDGQIVYEGSLCVVGSYTNVPGDLAIKDLVKIFNKNKGTSVFEQLYELLRINEIDNTIKIGHMSDGQKQKIKLLAFLSGNPDIIVLDEFTSALDKKSMLDIYEFIKKYQQKRNVLIINITHNILDLENLFGNYYYVTQKKIIQYRDKNELLTHYTNLD